MFYTLDKAQQAGAQHKTINRPAPVRGLIRNENIAQTKPGGAAVLENWFPTTTGVITRRGRTKQATLAGTTPVSAIMTYAIGGSSKLFAANDIGIYDATNPADASVALTVEASIGTVTSGLFSHIQFSTAGGDFLICVNGTNPHKVYSGSAWAENSPAITGTTSDNFSHVWAFKNRLFFVKKNSLKFCYLPVDSIGGAASEFNLGAVFKHGGTLLTGTTWSVDAGDGMDDLCAFITTEGEVAVYAGSNPGDANEWNLQGVYKIGRPLGKMAMFRAGGDVAVATKGGLVALSAAYSKAEDALRTAAVSYPIEELWTSYANSRNSLGWHCQIYSSLRPMLFVSPPTIAGQDALTLVANIQTGAWTVYTGFDIRSMGVLGDSFFYGTSNGIVYQGEDGASDAGQTYTCKVGSSFDMLGNPNQKTISMVRGTFKSLYDTFEDQWSISTDYTSTFPVAPSAVADPAGTALWGSGTWGSSVWGGTNVETRKSEWESVEGVGHAISWQLQISLGNTSVPDIELASVTLVYELGETVA